MTGKETYSEDQYDQLLDSIFSRHRSVQDAGFAGDAYKPGLARMRAFDALLGVPSAAFRSILVAGTNGKGSVSSLLAASLAATPAADAGCLTRAADAGCLTRAADAGCLTRAADAGCLCHSERAQRVEESPTLRVGLYTSPHLLDFRERIKILGAPGEPAALIPREAVYAFLQRWEADIDRLGLTFFEITTALAFRWFAEQEVDIAVVEVGLGGRLDSTNILTPALSVVTSIGLDHCALLGDTRAAIAAEKAGIFKPGVPALVGECDAETAPVFVARASAVACPLHFVSAPSFVIPSERSERRNLAAPAAAMELDLRGAYQARNLATALAALRLLGVPPQPDALRHAAA
ncbi:MAG: hypothetical protein K6F42_00195, partial [Bacteroidales bacterium]|nr:hypothetical protein [Bacteroidales bacterium]